jgi:hypothetical protein
MMVPSDGKFFFANDVLKSVPAAAAARERRAGAAPWCPGAPPGLCCMMRAVLGGVALCVLLAGAIGAQTMDEAVRALARKTAARLTGSDAPRVVVRNLSNLSAGEVVKARTIFERALRRPAPRTAQPLEVTLTLAQNARGYVLVADFERGAEHGVEIVEYHPSAAPKMARAVLERQLLWEQETPILDAAVEGDRMYVLEPSALAVYSRQSGNWVRAETRPSESPVVRDPRGRIEIEGGIVDVFQPGRDASFTLSGEAVKFSPGRNTLEAPGWPPFFSYARLDGVQFLAETDGRLHVYDAERRAVGTVETLGSDIVTLSGTCGTLLVASSPGDRDSSDTLTAFQVVDRKPVGASDPLQFSGAITALWPRDGGAVAIASNSATGAYAAYGISVRCSQ